MWDLITSWWAIATFVASLAAAIAASAHAIVRKRDTRAAVAWVALIWFSPLLGAAAYFCLGINRIARKGARLPIVRPAAMSVCESILAADRIRAEHLIEEFPHFVGLVRLVERLTSNELAAGNQVTPLVGGDETYEAMLAAINGAEHSLALCTYIFDHDQAGRQFLEALVAAVERGVQVRVLIDAVGARYGRPNMVGVLDKAGVPTAAFLPTRAPKMVHFANLRNHRKILVADGRVGFTGGTNIREGHQRSLNSSHPIEDIHFRFEGPVVAHLQEMFVLDWQFAAGERLEGEAWFPPQLRAGQCWARGIPDGPDEDFEKLKMTILGALAAARDRVYVVTPYFLPDQALITALNVAAMRGVEVHIVLPERNNIILVQWATAALLWQILERGCRVYFTPPPFDHTKLVLVDGLWSLVGSTNWDARSLRLNFEFNVECYDRPLAERLEQLVQAKIAAARETSLAEVDRRNLLIRLRDGTARLFSPYL